MVTKNQPTSATPAAVRGSPKRRRAKGSRGSWTNRSSRNPTSHGPAKSTGGGAMMSGPRAANLSSSGIDLSILGHDAEEDSGFSSAFGGGRRRWGLWSAQIMGMPGSQPGSGAPQTLQRASASPARLPGPCPPQQLTDREQQRLS